MEGQDNPEGQTFDYDAMRKLRRRHNLKYNITKSYRINVSFNLEVEIKDFDAGYVSSCLLFR